MSGFSCELARVLGSVLQLYWLIMLVYALVSWVPSLQGRWSYYLARLVEPVLLPFRRVIPPVGGLDLAFLVVLLLVGWLSRNLGAVVCSAGYSS